MLALAEPSELLAANLVKVADHSLDFNLYSTQKVVKIEPFIVCLAYLSHSVPCQGKSKSLEVYEVVRAFSSY